MPDAGGAGLTFNANATDAFGLGQIGGNTLRGVGDLFTSIVHPGNDNELLQQNIDGQNQALSIQASTALAAQQQTSQTYITIAEIIAAVLVLLIILWFLKT